MKKVSIIVLLILSMTLIGCLNKDAYKEGDYCEMYSQSDNIEKSIDSIYEELTEYLEENNLTGECKIEEDKIILYLEGLSDLSKDDLNRLSRTAYMKYLQNGLCINGKNYNELDIEIIDGDTNEVMYEGSLGFGEKSIEVWDEN